MDSKPFLVTPARMDELEESTPVPPTGLLGWRECDWGGEGLRRREADGTPRQREGLAARGGRAKQEQRLQTGG